MHVYGEIMNNVFLMSFITMCLPLSIFSNEVNSYASSPYQYAAVNRPSWIEDAVIYSIFPRNFSEKGNFNGIIDRLNQIKKLGVDVLWLLPIHPIGLEKRKGRVGSPYAVQDHEKIDSSYGDEEGFKSLVTTAHSLGFKIIIDAVLNHTAWDHVLMKYPELYQHSENLQIISPLPDWTDVAGLDYTNPVVQSYMLRILKYWLLEFDIDGFRFDASDFIPLEFWIKVRQELHALKPDILLLGEGEKPEALCYGFDLDYDWRFKKTLDRIIMDGVPATIAIKKVLEEDEILFPQGSLHLRFSDNHDERRAIARYGEKGALAASALIFTLEGIPLIYNGMEVGDITESRDPALFEKMPIFWDASIIRPEFTSFYTEMIALRKRCPALRDGTLKWIKNSSEERILTFLRITDEETLFVAINLSNQPFTGKVDLHGQLENVTPIQTLIKSSFSSCMLSLGAWEFCIYKINSSMCCANCCQNLSVAIEPFPILPTLGHIVNRSEHNFSSPGLAFLCTPSRIFSIVSFVANISKI